MTSSHISQSGATSRATTNHCLTSQVRLLMLLIALIRLSGPKGMCSLSARQPEHSLSTLNSIEKLSEVPAAQYYSTPIVNVDTSSASPPPPLHPLSFVKSLGYYCNAGNRHQRQAPLTLIPISPSLFSCGHTPTTEAPLMI